jgi:hypothetical protein
MLYAAIEGRPMHEGIRETDSLVLQVVGGDVGREDRYVVVRFKERMKGEERKE